MAHKPLINGTAYEISGGKTLVDGTAYEISGGKTLVGGTAYEVGFAEIVTVTVTSGLYQYHNSEYARVTINGVVYDGSETVEIPVEVGTTIECYIYTNQQNGNIVVDGEIMIRDTTGTYIYTVTKNCQIKVSHFYMSFGSSYSGYISITSES